MGTCRQASARPVRLFGAGRGTRRAAGAAVLGAWLAALPGGADAYTVTLSPKTPLTVYLQVGVGSFTRDYVNGGQPRDNGTINLVSTTVAATALGNGSPQTMTTNSSAVNSYFDGFPFCSVPSQLYIGGFYRTAGGATAAATVTATVPGALVNPAGGSIPFSQISWTSSGNADSGSEPFPAGSFLAGGTQTVGAMASNTWNESCWSFTYANSVVPAAGTFTGRVTFTLSAP